MTGLVTELVAPPTKTVTRANAPTERWRSWFAAGTLALALAPIVVSVVRAVATGWVPIFDAGYFTVRSRDVLSAHHPWVGAWSSASATLDATMHNLGPLQLDLLAPFTKIDPYWGTAVGVGVVAAASVVAVWWSARRLLGPIGTGGAMLATLALEATIGSQALIDPRQQIYLLMPYWALLWLAWAAAAGLGTAIPPLVFTASLIAQTHFTYFFQTMLVAGVGVGLYALTVRRSWREAAATRWLLIGLAVGLICWAQPFWDQIAGERNLGAVLANRGASEGVGWEEGARIIAGTVLVPPRLWLPGTMGDFALPADLVSTPTAWGAVVVWFGLLAAGAFLAWRRGLRPLAMLGVIAGTSLAAALVAGAAIPLTAFGSIPQNYFWMWPTGIFVTLAFSGAVLANLAVPVRVLSAKPSAIVLLSAALLVAVAASRQVDHFAPVPSAETAATRLARPVVEELAAGLRLGNVRGPVVVDYSRSSFGTYLRYIFLAELQDAGVEFTFPPDDRNLDRFGHERCEHGRASAGIILADAGGDPVPRDDEMVLAHVDAFTEADAADLAALDRSFGNWLRDRTVDIDVASFEFLAGHQVPELRQVLSSPGMPATGLATTIAPSIAWGVVDIPADLNDDFDRWVDLQTRAAVEDVTILLGPVAATRGTVNSPVLAVTCLH
jgi:hypothetical protein